MLLKAVNIKGRGLQPPEATAILLMTRHLIGVGRFRILGVGGGARFRIYRGGARGGGANFSAGT